LIFFHSLPKLPCMHANDVCAVILAGGQSRRMGFNKALLDVGGKPLINVLIDRIRPLTHQLFISSNDFPSYRFLNIPVIPDIYQDQGPLAGFHSIMTRYDFPLYLFIACDLPNLQLSFIRRLITLAAGYDATIPRTHDGISHPLCAVYRRTCFPFIEQALAQGTNKVLETFLEHGLTVKWVGPDEGSFKDSDLANINTPEDLQSFSRASQACDQDSIYSSQPTQDRDIL
jgi:molybdenum cofactor guanylyltransferase